MHLIIKNMVCPRCVASVEKILTKNKLPAKYVMLGEVELLEKPDNYKLQKFAGNLKQAGFELLDDQKMQLIERVKNLLVQKTQSGRIDDHFIMSKFLSDHIFKDYSAISRLFSKVEGINIEQFFILQKIEKIKELLIYNEESLGQISVNLGYSSIQHLSSQFKRVTGMTPSKFKQLGMSHRKPIDSLAS